MPLPILTEDSPTGANALATASGTAWWKRSPAHYLA
jgi:hypothetical protein